ncbi:MAG: hypothetical protein ACNA8W_03070 [Bradymonadaceae bacterium]
MSDEQEQSANARRDEVERRTVKIVRRTGYVVLFGSALLLCIPMVIAGVRGIQQERIWDPMTGEPVSPRQAEIACLDDAQQLIFTAGQRGQWTGPMEQRYRLWLVRCRADYPQAYSLLNTTRTTLKRQSEMSGSDPGEE